MNVWRIGLPALKDREDLLLGRSCDTTAWMASSNRAETLIEKLQDLPADKLVEVEDFVDFLRERQRRNVDSQEERLRQAEEAGQITPVTGRERSSVKEVPPVDIPGRPLSEVVIEDRR